MNKKLFTLTFSIILLSSFFAGLLGIIMVSQETPLNSLKNLSVTLEIKQYRKGQLIRMVTEKDDMILENFALFMEAFLTNPTAEVKATLHDGGGGGTEITVWSDDISKSIGMAYESGGPSSLAGKIGIGEGDTAATRSDYWLESEYAEKEATATYSSGVITIVSSIPITDTKTITEAIFFVTWWSSGEDGSRNYAFFRDVFTGVNVNDGDTLSLTYYLNLNNSGFTDQFGKLLAAIFSTISNAEGSLRTVQLTDITNNNRWFTVYGNTLSGSPFAYWFGSSVDYSGSYSGVFVAIGTGTTANGRALYKLATYNTENVITSQEHYDDPTLELYEYSTVTVSATATISEAGVYRLWSWCSGPSSGSISFGNVMLWRLTFAGVSVPTSQTISVKFTVGT